MKVKWIIKISNLFLIFLILLLFASLFSIIISANPVINEIMYDLHGQDSGREWIEIYNLNGSCVNLSVWKFYEEGINHNLVIKNGSSVVCSDDYAIIADDWTKFMDDYPNFTGNLFDSSFSLRNGGENISIKDGNGTLIDSVNYTNYVSYANGNNKSLERVNLTNNWAESIAVGGTPGFENSAFIVNQSQSNQTNQSDESNQTNNQTNNQTSNQTNQSEQQNQSKPEIELILNSTHLNINGNLRIFVNLTGNATGNLSVKIKRDTINGWIEIQEIFIKNNISNFIDNLTWIVPENAISGTYKVYARFEYSETHTSQTEEFNVSGVLDLGEYNLTVISSPETARFGDYKIVFVKFNSNNYNFPVLRFVSYVNHYVDSNEGPCISIDLNKENGCTKVYNLNTAVEISNISRGKTLYLAIPLLFEWNCDNKDHSYKEYTGRVGVYGYENANNTNNKWDKIIEEKFNITISGKNKELCEETIKYVEEEASKEDSNANSINTNSENIIISDEIQMEILNSPDEVGIKEEFTTTVKLANKGTKDINEIKIYSYIYKGNKVLSLGFNEVKEEWKGDWTANQKVFNLPKGTSTNITLKNKIKDDTELGTYDFKVRAKIGDKNYDIKREINVLEKKIINTTANSTTLINKTEMNNKLNETKNKVNNEPKTKIENKIQIENTEKSRIYTKTNESIESQSILEKPEFESQQLTTDGIKFSFLLIIVLLSIIVVAYKLINKNK